MQGLGGLAPGLNRGASMSGNKGDTTPDLWPVKFDQSAEGANQGTKITTSYTTLKPGRYQFVAWGAGGAANGSVAGTGGAGSLAIRTVRLASGITIPIVIGACSNSAGQTDSIVTLPDGAMTAGGGLYNGTTGGVATGGDINVNGANSGGAAGSYAGFTGGSSADVAPGGGFTGGRVIVIFLGP